MAVISLPLTFQNSFWSQDYRKGLEVLFDQLEQGIAENEEIVAFIRARATAEAAVGASLQTSLPGKAFEVDDGASLLTAFRGLREETIAQGKTYEAIANDLRAKIADPFEDWANGYKERLLSGRDNIVDGYLAAYEHAEREIIHLKNQYLTKTRKADEAEDDARFAPIPPPAGDKYTTSPNLGPRDKRLPPRAPVRQPTMSERITARLKEFRLNASVPPSEEPKPEVTFDADVEEKEKAPKVDKGKGRAVEPGSPIIMASPPPLSPPLPPARLDTMNLPPPPSAPPIDLAGVLLSSHEVSQLLSRAKEELPLRPVRFPLLGEYHDAFTGEEFSSWLNNNVKGFEGSLDRADEAARVLTEKQNLLRRLGELGNEFENADDAWYQFRPKAFILDVPQFKDDGVVVSPIQKSLSPLAENVAKRTTTFANLVSKALNTNPTGEPAFVKARKDADAADQEYRVAIRKLDRQRLGLEERIEETLKALQKWELDRLRAVKTVLLQYQACLENIPKDIVPSLQHSSTLIASFQPEADLKALIEQYRTGPFRPTAQVYESVSHDESDVVFGIDLRKWAELDTFSPSGAEDKKEIVPPVLATLLTALNEMYPKLPNDAEKRKTWIYDVPLPAVHHLRETLNAVPPEQDIPDDTLAKYDAPVLASAIKLWVLELDPPLCMYEGWDEFRKLYPTVGSSLKPEEHPSEEQHIQDLQLALQKLPKVHLIVLDTIVKHLKDLIDNTSGGEEPNEVFITKLALSIGRGILRPKVENKFSIQDRHPALLFIDLVQKYAEILPPTIIKKKRESERKVPVRRRTRPVDMRMSRSRISAGADLRELHAQQMAQRTGMKPKSPPPVPPVPAAPLVSPVPEIPETPSTARPIFNVTAAETAPVPALAAEPEEISSQDNRSIPAIPPPPTLPANIPPPPALVVPPPPPLPAETKPTLPTDPTEVRPTFKEPPPENDDLPPRPNFKEPAPEVDDAPLPMPSFPERRPSPTLPMPNFADPPPEPLTPPPATASGRRGSQSSTGSAANANSRTTSPKVPSRTGSISSRSTSPNKASFGAQQQQQQQDSASRFRGPRLTGPRGPGGGTVGNLVRNLNRHSVAGSPPGSGIARPTSPATSANGRSSSRPVSAHVKRSSASRASPFERRTMASDAEDEVVQ